MKWNSGIWWWEHCLWCKKVTQYSMFTASPAFTPSPVCISLFCVHWFDIFAPKTMSPPPYTTIPLHPLCALVDLFAPKTMSPPPHTTIPLHPLHTASTVSTPSSHLCVILTQPDIYPIAGVTRPKQRKGFSQIKPLRKRSKQYVLNNPDKIIPQSKKPYCSKYQLVHPDLPCLFYCE